MRFDNFPPSVFHRRKKWNSDDRDNLGGFIPLNMIPAIGHELTSTSLWSNSETWPPWEGGGQTRSQQCTKTRGDLEQSQHVARCGDLPAEVLPALSAAHPRPVATCKCESHLCKALMLRGLKLLNYQTIFINLTSYQYLYTNLVKRHGFAFSTNKLSVAQDPGENKPNTSYLLLHKTFL